MKTYLISYDLGIPETSSDYKKIIKYIKSFSNWAKPLKSQWFVVSKFKSVSDVRDDLKSLTDFNDKILVLDVTGDNWSTARIDSKITDWMNNNI